MSTAQQFKDLADQKYRYGFVTEIEEDRVAKGLSEEIIRIISEKKAEPRFMLEWRLKAYRHWLGMEVPTWANVRRISVSTSSRLSSDGLRFGAA